MGGSRVPDIVFPENNDAVKGEGVQSPVARKGSHYGCKVRRHLEWSGASEGNDGGMKLNGRQLEG